MPVSVVGRREEKREKKKDDADLISTATNTMRCRYREEEKWLLYTHF